MLESKGGVVEDRDRLVETPTQQVPARWTIFIGCLLLLAFFVRLYYIDAKSLWWDETLSVHRASKDIGYVISNKITIFEDVTIDQHPPLYFLLLHLSIVAFGNSEFSVRFISSAFILLAVPLSYQVGKQIWSRQAGIFSALAVAVSPFYLWYAQEARPYALVALLTTLSTYLLLKSTLTRSRRFLAGYVLVTGALLATHYLTAILIFAQAVYLTIYLIRAGDMRTAIGINSLFALVLALAFQASYAARSYFAQPGDPLAISIESVVRDIIVTFTFGVTVDQFAVLPFAVAIAVVAIVTVIVDARRQARKHISLLWICIVVSLAAIYVISLYKSVYGTRYVTFLAPMYYVVLGSGGAQLYRRHRLIGAAFGLCVLASAAFGGYDYFFIDNNDKQDYRNTARYIQDHAKPDDAIVLDGKRIVTAFEYYLKGDYALYGVPKWPTTDRKVVSRELREIAARHPRIWLVLSMSGDVDPKGLVETTLGEEYYQLDAQVLTGSTYSIGIFLYSVAAYAVDEPPADATKEEINFENQLALTAYSVEMRDVPANRLDVVLYWRTLARDLPRLAAFGQLIDSQGNVWGSFDGEPFNGHYTTDRWKQGLLIADQRELWITPGAPPGTYSLRLGVRLVESSADRLHVRDKNGQRVSETTEIYDIVKLNRGSAADLGALVLPKYYRAKFGDQVTLLGGEFASRSVAPGEELRFRLFWQSEAERLGELEVEFWLADGKGRSVKIKNAPINSVYPSGLWSPGQIVGAYYSVVVPAQTESSDYTLYMTVNSRGSEHPIPARFGLNPFPAASIQLGTVTVTNPDRQFSVPSSLNLVGVSVGQKAELLGFDFAQTDGINASSNPGKLTKVDVERAARGPIDVRLWWRALSEMDANYSVTVQVLNEAGQLVDQHDGYPAESTRPTAGWIAGEVILDTHRLSKLTGLPKGNYTLIVGMYDSATGERLKLRDETQDHIGIAEITIH